MELEVTQPDYDLECERFKRFLFKNVNLSKLLLRIEFLDLSDSPFSSCFLVSLLNANTKIQVNWPSTFIGKDRLLSFLSECLTPYRVDLKFLKDIDYVSSVHSLSTEAAIRVGRSQVVKNGHRKLGRLQTVVRW